MKKKSCTKCAYSLKYKFNNEYKWSCEIDGYPVDCGPPNDDICSDFKEKISNIKKPEKINESCFVIRTLVLGESLFWSGFYADSKWVDRIYKAKLYKSHDIALGILNAHKQEDMWNSAKIVKIKVEEVNSELN